MKRGLLCDFVVSISPKKKNKKKFKGFKNTHNKCLSKCEGLAARSNIFHLWHHCACTLTAQDFIHPDLEYFLEGPRLTASPESFFHCSAVLRMEKFLPVSSQTLSSSNSLVIHDLEGQLMDYDLQVKESFQKKKGKRELTNPAHGPQIHLVGRDIKAHIPVICIHTALTHFRRKSTSCSRAEQKRK